MSILSSGYMDGDGPMWPQPPSPELPSPSPVQPYRPGYHTHRHTQRRAPHSSGLQNMDPWKFPLLDTTATQHSKGEKAGNTATKSWFTAQQYAALGDFLTKAPKVLKDIERRRQQHYEAATAPSGTHNVDPWSFKKLPPPRTRANSGRSRVTPSSDQDAQAGAESAHEFQSRKSQRRPSQTPITKHRTIASRPKEPSQRSASPAAIGGLFGDDLEDPLDTRQEVVEDDEAPASRPAEKKNKKQLRKEAKARKAAEKTAAVKREQMKTQSRDESPSPSVKVAGWNMDPHSKPASDASRSTRSASIVGGGAEIGNMSAEKADDVASHRSHGIRRSGASRHENDGAFPIPGDWLEEPQQLSKNGRSKRSSSKREGSKLNSRLETIHEDAAPELGWGEEQVWRPPGHSSKRGASRRESSHQRSSHHSHRSGRSAAPEPSPSQVEQRSHGSRRSSPASAALASPVRQVSVISGPHTSYRAPTVQDAPDGWSPSWEKKAEQARSRRSGSVRTGTPSGHASAAAEILPESALSQRSHHTGLDGHKSPTRQGYRSKSAEKVNEWFESVPLPPPSKALSKEVSQAGSHRSSRRSHRSSRGQGAWENGEVPPDASVGTGYGPRKSEHGSQDRHSDKRTSSGSSTKADLGVRTPSARSARSSRHSWNAEPIGEAHGDW